MRSVKCRVGCAGWSLPKDLRDPALSYLERYAQLFSCVEINSSFYRHHQPKTYARWSSVVPSEFRFSVKVPKAVTHAREFAEDTVKRFIHEVTELGQKLGPVLLQFPPKAVFDKDAVDKLFSILREEFNGEVVCEPRHRTWFESEAQQLMGVYSISLVGADPKPVPNAPDIFAHAGLRYFRLHGAPIIYYSEYSPQFLNRFKTLESLLRPDTWVIFDNTAAEYAYRNALTLLEELSLTQKMSPESL